MVSIMFSYTWLYSSISNSSCPTFWGFFVFEIRKKTNWNRKDLLENVTEFDLDGF